jgi:hypothetical protein
MRLPVRKVVGPILAVAGALALGVCGGGGSSTGPSQPPVVTPTATPTPAATAEPPVSKSCTKLSAGNPNAPCQRESSDFQDAVDDAIRTLQGEQPQIFEGDQVLSVGAYYVGLIKVLDRKGLCADTDGEELGVANTNGFNDQFDVLSAKSQVRWGPASYRTTCYPSTVPLDRGALPPAPSGCTLPSSREVACGREPSSQFYGDVEAAITQILATKPELFDFSQTAPATDYPLVKDIDAYHTGVADIMKTKGYCAKADGEEIAVKRGTNARSEQYDVDLQGKYIRRGGGIYRVSCYPAAF